MANVCDVCGKKSMTGCNVSHAHNKTKKVFKPNLQKVRCVVDGAPVRVLASTKAIRMGLVVKPAKRKYTYTRDQKAAAEA